VSTPHERDTHLDQWLQRANAGADVVVTASCLDAETAAAWVEGGLTGHALARAEAHTANCPRCQALLRTLSELQPAAAREAGEPTGARVLSWWAGWRTWLLPLGAAATLMVAVLVWTRTPAPVVAPGAADTIDSARIAAVTQPPSDDRQLNPTSAASGSPLAAELQAARSAASLENVTAAVVELAPPGEPARWRLVMGLLEQRRGTAWQVVSEVGGPWTAGSAPVSTVCWLVGLRGAVARTSDGTAWTRLRIPRVDDLVNVRATSATAASVTTRNGETLSTTDAGATWH